MDKKSKLSFMPTHTDKKSELCFMKLTCWGNNPPAGQFGKKEAFWGLLQWYGRHQPAQKKKKKYNKLLNIVINKNITNSQQRLRLCNELEPTMHATRGQGWGVAWVAVVCGDFKPSETCLDLLSGVHGRNDNLKVARADILWKINKFGAWRNIPWEIFMAVDLSMELVITPKKWPLWG